MANACAICGKKRDVGHNVSHAKNRTRRIRMPNLHTHHLDTPDGRLKLRLCTKCIRSVKAGTAEMVKPVVAAN